MYINNFIILMPSMMNLLMIIILMFSSKLNKIHPISFLMILILSTFFICIKMNYLKKHMISYMLFLIMIGGLMVIFMYMTSLSNNEKFSFNLNFLLINLIKISPILIMFILTILYSKQMILLLLNSFQISEIFNSNELINFNMNIIYEEFNNKSTYFIMLYLYFSMICLMNICFKFKAPLRQLTF